MSPVRNRKIRNNMFIEQLYKGRRNQIQQHITDVLEKHILFLTG